MKRLILLSDRGNFTEWGPGCSIGVCSPDELNIGAGWTVEVYAWASVFSLGEFATERQARVVRTLWLQAIIAAPDGGLLRWDSEKEQVVDELAEGNYFTEETLL